MQQSPELLHQLTDLLSVLELPTRSAVPGSVILGVIIAGVAVFVIRKLRLYD